MWYQFLFSNNELKANIGKSFTIEGSQHFKLIKKQWTKLSKYHITYIGIKWGILLSEDRALNLILLVFELCELHHKNVMLL